MSATYEGMSPGGHETYATSIFSKIKTYLDDLETLEKTANGAIATFDDGSDLPMPSLKVAIEPQQDLHGYDAPWVGGAGKNKLPLLLSSIKAQNPNGWSGNTQTLGNVTLVYETIGDSITAIKATANSGANLTISLGFSLPSGSYILSSDFEETVYQYDTLLTTSSTIIARGNSASPGQAFSLAETTTVTWNLRIIKTGTATIKPMIRLASVTDATFEPYSNICPISGHTEANVTRTGKNLFDVSKTTAYKVMTENGETDNGSCSHSDYIKALPNTVYFLSNSEASAAVSIFCNYDKDKNFLGYSQTVGLSGRLRQTLTNTAYIVVNFKESIKNEMMVCMSSIEETYEPYAGTTYIIDLGGTRYGGTLDVVNGVLTVDRAEILLNGSETYTINSSGTDKISFRHWDGSVTANADGVQISNRLFYDRYAWRYTAPSFSFVVGSNELFLTIPKTTASTVEELKTWISSNNIQLVYELATPLTIQLTPTQVKSLLGQNNVWADTGDIKELIYFRNAKSTQAIRDIIDTTTAKDIAITTPDEMTATNVQEAIDEHTEMLTEQGEDISEIKSSLVNKQKNVLGDINVYWNGFSVTINFSGSADTVIQTGMSTDIVQLPAEVPLPNTTVYSVVSSGENTNQYVVIGILSDGWIRVYNHTGGSISNLYGNVTYLP